MVMPARSAPGNVATPISATRLRVSSIETPPTKKCDNASSVSRSASASESATGHDLSQRSQVVEAPLAGGAGQPTQSVPDTLTGFRSRTPLPVRLRCSDPLASRHEDLAVLAQ